MQIRIRSTVAMIAPAVAGLACAAAIAADIPESLRPPSNQVLVMDVNAKGFQVYECAANAGAWAWKFKGPSAQLSDAQGREVGKHYEGPTWELPDGSKVVGEVRASAPSPQAGAIPHLLLAAKSSSGVGALSRVRFVQRLDTQGGTAPAQPCDASKPGEVARVPYTARYVFYAEPESKTY